VTINPHRCNRQIFSAENRFQRGKLLDSRPTAMTVLASTSVKVRCLRAGSADDSCKSKLDDVAPGLRLSRQEMPATSIAAAVWTQ